MTDKSSYLTIQITEDGATKLVKTRENVTLETSPNLLDKSLNLADISIGEVRTIILIKLIRPDGRYTWLIKHPPEAMLCKGCTHCRCTRVQNLEDESLWILPKDSYSSDNPMYLTIQIEEDGEIKSVQARDRVLTPSKSLIEEPLHLGNISIGEFQTITLIKVIRSDNCHTWFIKYSVAPDSIEQGSANYKYAGVRNLDDEFLWVKPDTI